MDALLCQAAPPLGLIDAMVQFGMAGAVLLAVAGFVWYLERQNKRQDALDEKRQAVLTGLTEAVRACTIAVASLDREIREVRKG